MKHKCKALGIFALVCFLTYLYGCQKEEFEIEQPKAVNGTSFQVEVPAFESYYVPEDLKGKLVDRLFKALGYVTRTSGNVTESYETGIGTILTDEILAVEDDFGTKYTFKLDHPEKDFYTFFNLVMVDRGDDIIVLLKKYIMTEEFATLYRSDQKSVDDFSGSVATTRLTNPCLCEFPEDDEPVPVYPGDYTPGGSGGTVSGDGPSGSDGSPGGQDGGGPIITYCFLISFTIETVTGTHVKIKRYTLNTCTGEIIQHNKAAKKSKQGNNQTETYNENDCCNEGIVGILDGSNQNTDPCKELKKRIQNEEFLAKIQILNDASNVLPPNDRYEIGFLMKDINPTPTNPNTTYTQATSSPNFPQLEINLADGEKISGYIHNHFFINEIVNNVPFKSINVFSPADFYSLWWILKNDHIENTGSFVFIMVYRGMMYNLNITNKQKFIAFGDAMFINPNGHQTYGLEREFLADESNITHQNSQSLNRDNMAKMLKKYDIGADLYESSVANPQWKRVRVKSDNTIELKDCN